MNAGSQEAQEVPVDVLPPLPKDAYPPPVPSHPGPFAGLRTFYHPTSGVVILALDWLVFGTDFVTGFLALPWMCVLGFIASFPLILAIQLKWTRDALPAALGKAFLGAFMVGLPFPITGTILGAAILALSGLPHHPIDMVKRLVSRGTTSK
jgi:hypothetical protein